MDFKGDSTIGYTLYVYIKQGFGGYNPSKGIMICLLLSRSYTARLFGF